MKTLKRTLAIISAAMLLLSFGCSTGQQNTPDPAPSDLPASVSQQPAGPSPSDIEPSPQRTPETAAASYLIVDTGQTSRFGEYAGQDADFPGNQMSYTDNGDGTVTDNVTGLMWQQGFATCGFSEAEQLAQDADTGGYTDWRVPTIKELYSLIMFTGNQGSAPPESSDVPGDAAAFIDTRYFEFEYPSDPQARYIDAQYISSTRYVSTTMNRESSFFGVNFADGRIKGYPEVRRDVSYYLRLVRGNNAYGINHFKDNGDGTISDTATGLMWAQADSGDAAFSSALSANKNHDGSMDWFEALAFADLADYAGYSDWRLPSAKELQSIVNYTKSPDTSGTASIDGLFACTPIVNEMGDTDYAYYWTNTSFEPGSDAVYVAFGRALGYMNGQFMDVHGAGSQKTDPKQGSDSYGKGPQGDVRRVYNYVRLVRDIG